MSLPRFCFFVACLTPCLANARLGDTERQCIERYGSAIRPNQPALTQRDLIPGLPHAIYHYQGWNIRVAFAGGRVVVEEYQKKLPHPTGLKITTDEHVAILESEAAGFQWIKSLNHPLQSLALSTIIFNAMMGGQHWVRDDGAYATLVPTAYNMVLYSKAGIEAAHHATATKEQQHKQLVPKF